MTDQILKLDIGCGRKKREGFIGIDVSPGALADVYADPEDGLPFRDNAFSEVWMNHVFEHLDDTVRVMDEIWRVCRDGARVEIRGPHFSTPSLVWGDPTHKRGLSLSAFRYFNGDWYYSKAKYKIEGCILKKGATSFYEFGWKIWYWPFIITNVIIEKVVNHSLLSIGRYEHFGSRLIGFQEIRVVMSVCKEDLRGNNTGNKKVGEKDDKRSLDI